MKFFNRSFIVWEPIWSRELRTFFLRDFFLELKLAFGSKLRMSSWFHVRGGPYWRVVMDLPSWLTRMSSIARAVSFKLSRKDKPCALLSKNCMTWVRQDRSRTIENPNSSHCLPQSSYGVPCNRFSTSECYARSDRPSRSGIFNCWPYVCHACVYDPLQGLLGGIMWSTIYIDWVHVRGSWNLLCVWVALRGEESWLFGFPIHGRSKARRLMSKEV